MKKIFTLVFAITLSINISAQCPLAEAVDFTVTDVHGTEMHLFDILDGGQYVLIDFFYTTCGYCQESIPKIVESYYSFGCNQHDVFYMEISDRDTDAACLTWVNNYGVEYPTISGVAGGSTICNQYQIRAFPTIILINPDHSIVINDLWPIANAQMVVDALENQGVSQHECDDGTVDLGAIDFSVYPNPADDFVRISGENLGIVSVYNVFGQKMDKFEVNNEYILNTLSYENGVYFVKIGEKAQRFVVKH